MSNETISLSEYLNFTGSLIEKRLGELVPHKENSYEVLFQAARYSLLGGGKRLRPILALATTEMLGGSVDKALTAACALEIIHTYSLIHDDLPCMDNDDFRRGKPSLHKAYTEGLAVLTGDFLLTHAFQVIAEDPLLSSDEKIQLLSRLAKYSGGDGMIAGQVLDIISTGQSVDLEHLRLLHSKKTGMLITASVEFGGVLANAKEAEMTLLHRLGANLGLMFQIVDDILDVTASKEKHGRSVSSDVLNKKTTYVTLLGLEQAKDKAQALYHSSLKILESLPYDSWLLRHLTERILNRNS